MGRGVYVPREAERVWYFPVEIEHESDWDCVLEEVASYFEERYPSFYRVDEWYDREGRVLLRNGHGELGVSEYGGVVAVWFVPSTPLGEAWAWTLDPGPFARYVLDGHMSNGVPVFRAAEGG